MERDVTPKKEKLSFAEAIADIEKRLNALEAQLRDLENRVQNIQRLVQDTPKETTLTAEDPYTEKLSTFHEGPEKREHAEKIVRLFTDRYGMPKHVYYPGSGSDLTPVRALPSGTEVVFIDPEEHALRWAKEYAQKEKLAPTLATVVANAETYTPEHPIDLLFGSASSTSQYLLHHLHADGHLLHQRTYVDWAFDDPRLELVGVFPEDSTSLVEDPEELKKYIAEHPHWIESGRNKKKFYAMGHSPWGSTRALPAEWYVFKKRRERGASE